LIQFWQPLDVRSNWSVCFNTTSTMTYCREKCCWNLCTLWYAVLRMQKTQMGRTRFDCSQNAESLLLTRPHELKRKPSSSENLTHRWNNRTRLRSPPTLATRIVFTCSRNRWMSQHFPQLPSWISKIIYQKIDEFRVRRNCVRTDRKKSPNLVFFVLRNSSSALKIHGKSGPSRWHNTVPINTQKISGDSNDLCKQISRSRTLSTTLDGDFPRDEHLRTALEVKVDKLFTPLTLQKSVRWNW
jgi:hypothetical protein